MRKLYFLCFFMLLSCLTFAQLDRKHWFAPMVDRTGNPFQHQTLYLSTNRTTPFPVKIFNNNVQIASVTISKGNPQKYNVPRDFIITTNQNDLFTPTSKGLYLEADFTYYANLRFSVYNHAEIITSKGIPSTGTLFYAAMMPVTTDPVSPYLNFMTGILATEDNTQVTISGYSPAVLFSNGISGATQPTITFNLNKGQSYIIDGLANLSQNTDAFIGAKIQSTKPVNVTNGNFNGQYAGNITSSSDILMDQSVPVNQLGDEFILVKGNGTLGSNMEGAIVVATQDNTQIFVNNETVPVATINTGKYFVIPDSKYQLQGNGHYNLYIQTSKNAYVYQMLAGSDGTAEAATGGFNFIPALNCYLPKQINELGLIDENFVVSNANSNGILNIPTKLNLVTEKNAVVTVNGVVPPATTGPFSITGNNNWVTYGIPNVSGTLTINSTKAITAGITAGSDAVGYGGFFAGFPTQPIILSSGGTCIPGITLSVDPVVYEQYQWFLNGQAIPGANSPTFSPTVPGNYTASVVMGSCAPLVTEKFKVQKCLLNSTAVYSICTPQTILPVLSSPSIPQSILPSSVSVVGQPTLGTAVVNPTTGQIIYTPNTPNSVATDTFSYTFCGDHAEFPECETVTVTIHIQQIVVNNASLQVCNNNGFGVFNLSNAVVTSANPVTYSYYPTLADAQNENPAALINGFTNYSAPHGTQVFVVVKNASGCKSIAQITLNLFNLAVVSNYNGVFCDDDFDGDAEVNLNTITAQVLNNPTYFTNVRYYANLVDANAGNNNTLPNNWSFGTATTIYIRVDSPDGCPAVIKALNFTIGAKVALTQSLATQTICDDNFDGTKSVNLNDYIQLFTTDSSVIPQFFSTLNNAQLGTNPISSQTVINGLTSVFIRFTKTGLCPNIATLQLDIKTPKKSDVLLDKVICSNEKTDLDAGSGFENYLWSTGATTQQISNVGPGNYWVELTFNGCVYKQLVEVSTLPLPEITAIDIKDGDVTVIVIGGNPPYQYSLDGQNWQSSNVFLDLDWGNYTVYVKDRTACNIINKPFTIINLINAITPNGDGVNETLDYSSLLQKTDPSLKIFDRYGNEIFRGNASNRFIWDGRIYGRPVPTATYWYIIEWKELGSSIQIRHTSWLLVKHRNDNYFKGK